MQVRLLRFILLLALVPRASPAAEPEIAVLPKPISTPPVAYPPRALEQGVEATVPLRLVVDAEGRVTDVLVMEHVGHGFDELAVVGARQMRFEPGRDADGKPVQSEILYGWPFQIATAPPLSIEGELRERGSRNRLAGLLVEATGPQGDAPTSVLTISDEDGTFRFAGLDAGVWTLSTPGHGIEAEHLDVTVPVGEVASEVVLLAEVRPGAVWNDIVADEVVEVRAQRRRKAPVERVLSAEEVSFLPGSLGDPVRAVQNLPGNARPPFGSGELLVRGTDAGDTAYLLDGMRVPVAFHFSALSTVINPAMLDEIVFAPGNWSVRYGRAIGGLLDLVTPDELPTHPSTTIGADIFQARAYTSLPLGRKSALFASVRRSYLDAVLNPVLGSLGADTIRAPVFYDAQVRWMQHIGQKGRVSGTFLLSDDQFRILGEERSRPTDLLAYTTSFQKVQLRWTQALSDRWSVETSLMVGPEARRIHIDDPGEQRDDLGITDAIFSELHRGGGAEERGLIGTFRHEWRRDAGSRGLGLTAGIDSQIGRHEIDHEFGDPLQAEATIAHNALYLEPRLRHDGFALTPGVRLESYYVAGNGYQVRLDPRLSAGLQLGRTVFTAGVGSFSQPPTVRELLAEEGPDLGFERALQTSVGVQLTPVDGLQLGLTLYHHRLRELVVGRDDAFRFDDLELLVGDDNEPFANEGRGRATGVEALLRYSDPRWTAWLAATLSSSRRLDRPREEPMPSGYDQPFVLTAILSHLTPVGVRAGARARWAAGPPMTPVLGSVFIVDNTTWLPVYGRERSARLPSFFALDVRVDRVWTFRHWRLTTYLEVQNATNRKNVEIPAWSRDYSRFEPVHGLPILPALGVEASW